MATNFLIIGQGDIGLPVTNALAAQGKAVTGLARGVQTNYELHAAAQFLQADATQLTAEQLQPFSHIAIIVTPNEYSETAYRHTYLGIAEHIADLADHLPNLQRLVFISSTGVYGQDAGEWIDETVQPLPPKRQGSQYILAAEKTLQNAFVNKTIIIRPSGIYGKQRLMRIRQAQKADSIILPAYEWTNRIIDTDLVTVIVKVLTLTDNTRLKPLYIATDYRPVTSYELTCWLCEQLGTAQPSIDMTKGASGKRLHSNIPLDWLNYPDWQLGYQLILATL
ncbi:SDR family oxidoreductase [Psychrobacter sp. I-STPA10]|uniref:SDR family oxidoreductase n=1 Tax=Psychrobacter sp. I-STPA10 TaxID=2585769 RepID=UPI001E54ECF9|nr:SDR family oxidoreductase [Psychrobacter sp. I-STPA10]